MLALTLHHPWAAMIADYGKDIENRRWSPQPRTLKRGELFALHGGRPEASAVNRRRLWQAAYEIGRIRIDDWNASAIEQIEARDYSGVFAVALYGGVMTESRSPWFVGPKGWILGSVLVLNEPIAERGKQGLWPLRRDVEARVRAAIDGGLCRVATKPREAGA